MKQYTTLSLNVIPTHYTLTFEPDFQQFKFKGKARIEVQIQKSTKVITLHAKELKINTASLWVGKELYPGKIKLNPAKEELILSFSKLCQGRAVLELDFTGIHNDAMYGFYRSQYQQDNKTHYILTTQFEAANARAAFPCFDEPAFKATFDVSLIVPKDLLPISNMPIKEEKVLGNKKHVTFLTSPRMSTYLLYLAVGPFKYISTTYRNIDIRVIATPDKIKLGNLALQYTKTFLQFFENYFNIKYPLPKLDIIAIPDFASGAMENWGAITFREIAVLGDEHTSVMVKQNIAITIAHELAHQWFGNLVTMQWWDDLWLNESFATFMSYKAVHAAYPQWELPLQYFYDTIADALGADQLDSTHPISVKVTTPGQIDEIFDHISYDKGGSVLHMLEDFVGEEHFKVGLSTYLKTFSYSNATKYDLWNAIQQAHHQPGITTMMENWINLKGYPVVEVHPASKGYTFHQRRFTLLGKKYSQRWHIPIHYHTSTGKSSTLLLTTASTTIPESSPWIKLNTGQHGFYRVYYAPELLEKIGTLVREKKFSALDAAGIENDVYSLMISGEYSMQEYLSFIERNYLDSEYPANAIISAHINGLLDLTYGKKAYAAVQKTTILLHRRLLEHVGWVRHEQEKNTITMLRSMSIASLGLAGDQETLKKISGLFAQVQQGKQLDPNLRGVIYSLTAWQGDTHTFDYLFDRYTKEQVPEENRKLLRSLGMFRDLQLLHKALELSQSSSVRLQDSILVPMTVAGNPAAGHSLVWRWTKKNWLTLLKKYGSGTHMIAYFIHNLAGAETKEQRADIKRFFAAKENFRDDIRLASIQTLERIDILLKMKKRNGIE